MNKGSVNGERLSEYGLKLKSVFLTCTQLLHRANALIYLIRHQQEELDLNIIELVHQLVNEEGAE